jgi:hypothetical protein
MMIKVHTHLQRRELEVFNSRPNAQFAVYFVPTAPDMKTFFFGSANEALLWGSIQANGHLLAQGALHSRKDRQKPVR